MKKQIQPTPDQWSMEETMQTPDGATMVFKPYDVFKMWAVFKWIGLKCETLYDGSNESEARKIFEA